MPVEGCSAWSEEMREEEKTKEQLVEELKSLRKHLAKYKDMESENRRVTEEL